MHLNSNDNNDREVECCKTKTKPIYHLVTKPISNHSKIKPTTKVTACLLSTLRQLKTALKYLILSSAHKLYPIADQNWSKSITSVRLKPHGLQCCT